jgi:hypothetical protein
MPLPPTEIDVDPGKGRNKLIQGPRRPVRLHNLEFGLDKWRWRGDWFLTSAIGTLGLWFSEPQKDLWNRQVVCAHCGVGVGVPCVGRSIKWGVPAKDDLGLPTMKQTLVPYTHSTRVKEVGREYTAKIPWEIYPDWVWWGYMAIGQDAGAFLTVLSHVRSAGFATRYVERYWQPELERQHAVR